MAQAIFNTLAVDRNLPFRAESVGTAALECRPIAANAVEVLQEAGIHPDTHRARQVDKVMIEQAELVLAMSPQHTSTLHRLCDNPSRKIYTLPEYAIGPHVEEGIPDPYGHSIAAYRSSVRQLSEYVGRAMDRLGR
jgi:protein-tyrosine phosphatase